MTGLWSIRGRTALVFALASMGLTAGVLAFVNVASSISLPRAIEFREAQGTAEVRMADEWATTPDPSIAVDPSELPQPVGSADGIAIVSTVTALQWQWSAVGIVVAGALAGGVGWGLSRRVLRPIDRITATARRLSASTLHERIGLEGPDDELRRLSRTIDALLDRLETAFESQRRFVAQASHELRTPLAVQRAAIQIGLHDDVGVEDLSATREELLAQNRRTEHLVESLLVLAEAERGIGDRVVEVDLDAVIADVLDEAASAAADRSVEIQVERPDRPTKRIVHGEPMLVRQAIANLVDNAVEYNHPGGFVRVQHAADSIVVENSGSVLSEEFVASLGEPFRRGGSAGTKRHSGLGLSIVRAIAQAHGASLHLAPRAAGGLRIELTAMREAASPRGERPGVSAVQRHGAS